VFCKYIKIGNANPIAYRECLHHIKADLDENVVAKDQFTLTCKKTVANMKDPYKNALLSILRVRKCMFKLNFNNVTMDI